MRCRRWHVLVLASLLLGLPLGAPDAQQPARIHRIGHLLVGSPTPQWAQLWQELGRLGYVEGQTLAVERRYPQEPEQLAASAADLLARNVDIIVTGGTPAALAAQKATADIPIVFSLGGNPVQRGLIASYERPGGNITGFVEAIVFDRKLEILKEAIPGLVRVACPCRVQTRPAIGAAAHRLGLELQDLDALQLQHLVMQQPEHFVQFVETAKRRGSDGLLIPNLPGFGQFLPLAGRLAAANGLPAIGFGIAFVASGGLLSFGPKEGEGQVAVASIVHRVFQGARPGDIPVVRQRALTLGVNLKTAKALGQAIPPSLLARADEVIE